MALVGGKIQIRTIYHLQTMRTLTKKPPFRTNVI